MLSSPSPSTHLSLLAGGLFVFYIRRLYTVNKRICLFLFFRHFPPPLSRVGGHEKTHCVIPGIYCSCVRVVIFFLLLFFVRDLFQKKIPAGGIKEKWLPLKILPWKWRTPKALIFSLLANALLGFPLLFLLLPRLSPLLLVEWFSPSSFSFSSS